MPHIAELREIDGEVWAKVAPMNFGREGGHGSIHLLNDTEMKQIRLSAMREVANNLAAMIDNLAKEIY